MEKLYGKMTTIGVSNLVMGIITMGIGIATGIVMIVNGARLLHSKRDITF